MTAQPTDSGAEPAAPPRYSEKTLRRIKYARVTRDTILFVGGVVFAVLGFAVPKPPYTVNDPIGIFAIIIAVVFGIAAFFRAIADPEWDRDWSRTMRYTCSIIFILAGIYFMLYATVQSGYVGARGTGLASNCTYESEAGIRSGGSQYVCDVYVHWPDGTVQREVLSSAGVIQNGRQVVYAKPPNGLFLTGEKPVAAWTDALFYFLTGLVIFLQSLFALCVLIFGRTPPRTD